MKKLISVPVIFILILTLLAGCSGGGNSSTSSKEGASSSSAESSAASEASESSVSSEVSEVESSVSSEASESEVESSEASKESVTVKESSAADESDTSIEKTPVRGLWTDNTYTNEYMNLTYTMPEGWVYATDEQIASAIGMGVDLLSENGMEITQEMLEQQTLYDMMAQDATAAADDASNVMVLYENLAKTPGGSMFTEELYLTAVKTQMEAMDMGYTFSDEMDTKTIGGETYTVLTSEMESNGSTIYQAYFTRKIDSYMVSVILTAKGGDTLEDLATSLS